MQWIKFSPILKALRSCLGSWLFRTLDTLYDIYTAAAQGAARDCLGGSLGVPWGTFWGTLGEAWARAISSDLYHTPKMGGILISWCYRVKNVSNNSIGGQWWRNDPCVSSFLLQNFFPDNFVNMSHTNFWQFFQISDLILHDKCVFKLF